jgi:tryptophanyl-tRNA synthetase
MKTILTGIKPTGMPHLGNLLGAIRPAIEMSHLAASAERHLYFIADYHALTSIRDPKMFKQYVYEIAATWVALGLDTNKAIFYKQSDVPEIFELQWMLACMTPKGDMNRAHSYKAKVQENEEKGQKDLDHGVNMGLFNYPILMSADILLFDTNLVPVGKDQVQHVEIARSIAQRVNQYFGQTLVEPQELLQKEGAYIPGLDGRKMSKSYDNTIPLFVPEKKLQKLINKITTDSLPPEAPKNPDDSTIMDLYKLFASNDEVTALRERYQKGIGWGEAKAELFIVINRYLSGPRQIYEELINDKTKLDAILADGAKRAREIAKINITKIRSKITGF